MAVTGTITITTVLFFYIARRHWHWPRWLIVVGGAACCTVDLLFLAANLTKLIHGGVASAAHRRCWCSPC